MPFPTRKSAPPVNADAIDSRPRKCPAGQSVTGVLVRKGAKGVVVRDAKAVDHAISHADLDRFRPSRLSLMATGLLADSTPQQAADLLAFLMRSKK